MLFRAIRDAGKAVGDSQGATAVEYAIMAGFIAVVIVVGVAAFGNAVKGLFELWPGL